MMRRPLLHLLLAALSCVGVVRGQAPSTTVVPGEVRDRGPHDKMTSTLWLQSAEYEACARQAYLLASLMLDRALEDPTWTAAIEQDATTCGSLPPAIILDVDETVLHNSAYQAQLIRTGKNFERDTWNGWCRSLRSAAISGARRFCEEAWRRGVTPYYLTNRKDEVRASTLENLRMQGFPLPDGGETLITNSGVPKTQRRAEISQRHRVIMLLGDNLADFTDESHTPLGARRVLPRKYATWWGTRWIILPNPIYGDWENALHEFNMRLSPEAVHGVRFESLEP